MVDMDGIKWRNEASTILEKDILLACLLCRSIYRLLSAQQILANPPYTLKNGPSLGSGLNRFFP